MLNHVVSGMTLLGFAIALLIAASPKLHEWIHHDADEPQHLCLATAINSGACDDAVVEPLVVAAFLNSDCAEVSMEYLEWVESVFASGSVFEHAPPFVS